MKTFAISAMFISLLGNVVVAQERPSSVTLQPVDGAPFTLEFTKANHYYVKTSTSLPRAGRLGATRNHRTFDVAANIGLLCRQRRQD